MTSEHTTTLIKLSDSDLAVADPAEDIRGRPVHDSAGQELGMIADLLIDKGEVEVRFLLVEHGGILGFGATPSFVPVDAISRITDDAVHLGESRDRVAGAPPYDPELFPTQKYYDALYAHYGYGPYPGTPRHG